LHTSWFQAARFERLDRQPLGQRLGDMLRRLILSGDLRPGERLPPIRQLAELTEVSIPTAREAVQSLVALGLLRTEHGVGTFVTRRRDEQRLLSVGLRRASTTELADLCALLDQRAAARAARRFSTRRPPAASVASLLLFLARERSRRRASWPEVFTDSDAELHDAVMNAAGRNGYFAARFRARIARRLRPRLVQRAVRLADDADLDRGHLTLSTAIIEGDGAGARRIATEIAHIESAALG
jgi:GntR family transcriptional repressor for pyruvate dehydrogenase complex